MKLFATWLVAMTLLMPSIGSLDEESVVTGAGDPQGIDTTVDFTLQELIDMNLQDNDTVASLLEVNNVTGKSSTSHDSSEEEEKEEDSEESKESEEEGQEKEEEEEEEKQQQQQQQQHQQQQQVETVEVLLKQGAIFGKGEMAADRYFYSFLGIPFAQPPTGRLRFRDPVPASSWNGTRNGTIAPPICPQLHFYFVVGEEDCLYLNVFTPRPYESDLPVMVWFHGGRFKSGGAEEFPPLPLLTKDIVLVVIQYRLGTLGFLSTEDSIMPGNLGLKDQTLALQWVRNNIRDFGGNPNKVTIFGESAGAALVHFQVLSPKTEGLFQRAIMQSGSAIAQWALRTDHKRVAITIGKVNNCSAGVESLDSAILLACLQELPVNDIVSMPSLFELIMSLPDVMTPRVDGDFVPAHPATLLKEGKYNPVDVISGVNKHEGAATVLPFVLNPWLVTALMENFDIAAPALLSLEREDAPVDLARQIFSHYLKGRAISKDTEDATVQMASDIGFRIDHDEVVRIHAADETSTYSYELRYRGQYSFADVFGPNAGKHWVTHTDELPYLFNDKLIILQEPDDFLVRDLLVTLWTNFAMTGNPTPDNSLEFRWLPATPSNLNFLAITTIPYMQDYDRAAIMKFWHSLPTLTNKLLFPHVTPNMLYGLRKWNIYN